MNTLCSDNLKLIFGKLQIVDLFSLSKVNSTFNALVNSILTEKYCAEQFIQLFGMPMVRKPKHLTFKQFWYSVSIEAIKPVKVNKTVKLWVDNTVTFATLGLEPDFCQAKFVSVKDKIRNYDFNLHTLLFPFLTGRMCNTICNDVNDNGINIRSS